MLFPRHLNNNYKFSNDLPGAPELSYISLLRRPWAMDVANPSSDFEAPKDPGAHKAFASVTDNEILGKIYQLN